MDSKIKKIVISTLNNYNLQSAAIFGSYARGEENKDSDLDILISLNKDLNLLDIIGIEQELEDKLGIKVQIITDRSLNFRLRDYIYKDLIKVL